VCVLVICILYFDWSFSYPDWGFSCFFLNCKANARVKLAKTGHGPHSSTLVAICVVRLLFVLFYVLFVCKCVLPPGDNPNAVNKYINKYLFIFKQFFSLLLYTFTYIALLSLYKYLFQLVRGIICLSSNMLYILSLQHVFKKSLFSFEFLCPRLNTARPKLTWDRLFTFQFIPMQ